MVFHMTFKNSLNQAKDHRLFLAYKPASIIQCRKPMIRGSERSILPQSKTGLRECSASSIAVEDQQLKDQHWTSHLKNFQKIYS